MSTFTAFIRHPSSQERLVLESLAKIHPHVSSLGQGLKYHQFKKKKQLKNVINKMLI